VTCVTEFRAVPVQDTVALNRSEPHHQEAIMKRNVGGIDKTLRIVVGLGLLSLLFILEGGARWLGLIGLVPLGTALIGFCPLYAILGVSTCPTSRATPHRA
jgi:hypothetical protein